MEGEFARLLPERLGPAVTVTGFARRRIAIREAHFGFAVPLTRLLSEKKTRAANILES